MASNWLLIKACKALQSEASGHSPFCQFYSNTIGRVTFFVARWII